MFRGRLTKSARADADAVASGKAQTGKRAHPSSDMPFTESIDDCLVSIYRREISIKTLEPARLDIDVVDIEPLKRGSPVDYLELLRRRVCESEKQMTPETLRLRRRILDIRVGRGLAEWRRRFPAGRITAKRRYHLACYDIFRLYPRLALCSDFQKHIAPRADALLKRLAEVRRSSVSNPRSEVCAIRVLNVETVERFFAQSYPGVHLFKD